MSDWAQSRAVAARRAGGGKGGSGVGSWQRRLPRSKVGGMAFVTVMELGGKGGGVSEVGCELGGRWDLRWVRVRGGAGSGFEGAGGRGL